MLVIISLSILYYSMLYIISSSNMHIKQTLFLAYICIIVYVEEKNNAYSRREDRESLFLFSFLPPPPPCIYIYVESFLALKGQ